MFKPETTLRLLKGRFWGAKAMERRLRQCCADNPECPHQAECRDLYDTFVSTTEGDRRKEIYHQLREFGVRSIEARANLSATRVKELEMENNHG